MSKAANEMFDKLGGRNKIILRRYPRVGENVLVFDLPDGKTINYFKVADGYKIVIGSDRKKALVTVEAHDLHPLMYHWFNAVASVL